MNPPTPALCQGRGGAWNHRSVELGSRVASKATRPQTLPTLRRPPRQQLLQLQLLLQDCRLLGLKPPKRFQPSRRPPRQQLLQLHTATTCPCHLGFKTALCPASNPPNASNPPAGLQGNNSYSYYMPLPSVFQGVQDCRLPALKPPKPSRRPPRQQLLQLHAPAICFSGGSRQVCLASNPPNASAGFQGNNSYSYTVATTCPCHLFFRRFKTAVCPASNPQTLPTLPQASKATTLILQLLYYMPLPSVFQGVQDCRLPALKPPKPSRRPPRQQLLQLHAPAIDFIFQGVQDCRLPGFKPSKRFRRLPRQQRLQLHTCPCHLFFKGFKPALTPSKRSSRPPRQQLLQLHAPAICFSGGSRQVCLASNPPNASAGFQGNNSYSYTVATTCPCHLFFRGFKTAVCPASNPPNASNPPAGLQGNNSYSYYMPLPSGVQDCRLPGLKPPKRFQPSRRPPRQQLLQLLHAPAICFSRGSRLPFARPQTPQTLPQASKATTLTATTCPCHLFFRGFLPGLKSSKPSRRPPRQPLLQLHAPAIDFIFQGVQDCRLPGLKPSKRFRRLPRQQLLQLHTCPCHLFFRGFKPALTPSKRFRRLPRQQLLQLQLHAPAICFSAGSRLPFAWPQTPQTLPTLLQASKATTLITATTCPCHLFFRGSKLPFARPQTPQTLPTLPQASKATTLTATTCPCHLFFRGFKTAVCPPSNPPNPPAGLPGNNSYSYMPLPSILFFKGFKTAVCLASNPPNASAGFQGNNSYSYIHAPAICCSGGSSPPSHPPNAPAGLQGNHSYSYMPLPSVFQGVHDKFAWPQTLQMLPQASKATTLTATL